VPRLPGQARCARLQDLCLLLGAVAVGDEALPEGGIILGVVHRQREQGAARGEVEYPQHFGLQDR